MSDHDYDLDNKAWRRASRRVPCPVCGKHSWCAFVGTEGAIETVLCMKMQSDNPRPKGGWLHRLREPLTTLPMRGATRTTTPKAKAATSSSTSTSTDASTSSSWASLDDLVGTYKPSEVTRIDEYHNRDGLVVGAAVRLDKGPDDKQVLPARRNGDGRWTKNHMPEPRPLFRLPELLASDGPVLLGEGEKTAEALRYLGFTATTWAGGCKAYDSADFSPLAGRDVVLLPDHDDPGREAMDSVTDILGALRPQPTVRRLELTTLPDGSPIGKGGDAADWALAGGTADQLVVLLDDAETVDLEPIDTTPAPRWKPFPTELLPEPLKAVVVEGAKSIGCDEAFLALPGLAAAAGAIGATRIVRIKHGWNEPAVLWCVVVSPSGATKSQGRKLYLASLLKRQREAEREYERRVREHGVLDLEYERDLAHWKKSKGEGPPPDPPEKPQPIELFTTDATVESMSRLLAANPRGVLLECDELTAWFRTFNLYNGGKGADAQHWINFHGAGHVKINRAGLAKPIFLQRAAASVSGTIQPELLADTLRGEHTVSGFAARLLMAEPPRRQKRWTDEEVSEATERAISDRLGDLLDLDFAIDDEGEPFPIALPLSTAARRRMKAFVNEHGAEGLNRDGAEAAAWSKLESYAVRLALVLQLIDDPDAKEVSDAWLETGIELSRWFGNEAARFYRGSGGTPQEREDRKLIAWIEAKGGDISAREVQQGRRTIKTAADAEAVLERLVAAGEGEWRPVEAGEKGGRPCRRFHLACPSTSTEPPQSGDSPGSVDVDSADGSALDDGWEEV